MEFYVSQNDSSYAKAINRYYNEELPKWEEKTKIYSEQKAIGFSESELLDYRKLQLDDVSVTKFSIEDLSFVNKRGIKEDFFYNEVVSELGDYFEIHKNKSVGDFYPSYTPDIIIKVTDKFFFDVEIDEPYTFENSEPIHFEGADDKRNFFFYEKGWFVIRFSEHQILFHTKLCLDVLSYSIDCALKFQEVNFSFQHYFMWRNGWTYDEAVSFAELKTREEPFKIFSSQQRSKP